MQLFSCCLHATAFLLFLCQYSQATEDNRILACYLDSALSSTTPNFLISEIDPFLCTHIIYEYAVVNKSGMLDSANPDIDLTSNDGLGLFAKVTALKERNPELKVLVTVVLDTTTTISLGQVAYYRKRFISSTIQFLRQHKFDGLDVSPWCGVLINLDQIQMPYFINLLKENCVKNNLEPVSNNKLVLSIPLTGEAYKEKSRDAVDIVSLLFRYYEVCNLLQNEGWTNTWDETSQSPVAVKGKNKIFYENERSVALKAQIAVAQNLKGMAVRFIENDDFQGVCSQSDHKQFPLINKIKNEIGTEPRKNKGDVIIVIEEYG